MAPLVETLSCGQKGHGFYPWSRHVRRQLQVREKNTWHLKTTRMFYHTVFEGQESGCGLAGCLWLRVSHEAVAELPVGGCSCWKLENLLPSSLTWLLAGNPNFLACGTRYTQG